MSGLLCEGKAHAKREDGRRCPLGPRPGLFDLDVREVSLIQTRLVEFLRPSHQHV